jgi:hypothetical protein
VIAPLEYLPLSCSLFESPALAPPEVHVSIAATAGAAAVTASFHLQGLQSDLIIVFKFLQHLEIESGFHDMRWNWLKPTSLTSA